MATRLLPQINLAKPHHQVLQKEFPGYSKQAIRMALLYQTNSDFARQVRKRAKELLQNEIKSIIPEQD